MNSRAASRRQTLSDRRPLTFTPKCTDDEYRKAILYHAKQSPGGTLYPGEIYQSLSRFINARSELSTSLTAGSGSTAFAWLTSPCRRSQSEDALPHDKSSASENGAHSGRFERFADPESCIEALRGNIEASQPQVLFLRGHLSPGWVRSIGAFCYVDPELFRWFLRYRESPGGDYYFDSAPSAMSNIFRFRFYTIGSKTDYYHCPQHVVDAMRAEASRDFESYKRQLFDCVSLATGSSIVRNFHALDERHCVIEQEMDISIFEIGKTWMAIACTDAGDDLANGPKLPWASNMYNPNIMWLPIMQYRPKYALKSPGLNKSESASEGPRNAQSLAVFPEGYGRNLAWCLASHNRFHVLEDVFRLAAFSQNQLLNLIEGKVRAETDRFSQSRESPTLNNLLHFRDVLEDQIQAAEEMFQLSKQSLRMTHADRRHGATVTPEQKAATDQAVAEVRGLFRDLRGRAQQLHGRCTQEMTVISNNSMLLESQRAMQQARIVTKLTLVAFVYLPFSFTAGFFGMNFKELGTGTISLWIFFAASLPLMLITLGFFLVDVDTVKEVVRSWRGPDTEDP
ncbi:corA-like mg2+ transporter protein domain-containing protein [Cordyceps javanica]|uniref:CorA-like mg2+ transporter protein domain-containing protein n=1 Tax=Cordyceps javanica TaxID=43265 RepID=A0A545W231_9HYPO|nr:corA-like mg2+ transporter protein domain-containing protein [Cordyceps javanica]TQW08030.1 corA-like mg2+ transporter protein domain-containing protein [Cordyceps javanica]